MPSFGTLGQLLKLPTFSTQKCHSAGGRGGPRFFFIGILIFMLLRSPCKNLKTYDNPKNLRRPKIVAYLSLLCWSHALRSDQLPKIIAYLILLRWSRMHFARTQNYLKYRPSQVAPLVACISPKYLPAGVINN